MFKRITLKTLPEAAQEVFDWVANHLITRGQQCRDAKHDRCSMRGRNGTACAAGALIANEEYDPEWDEMNRTWVNLVNNGKVSGNHFKLIDLLQSLHDNGSYWTDSLPGNAGIILRGRLEQVAINFSLEYKGTLYGKKEEEKEEAQA